MENKDYKLSEEYRERFTFNIGERYWMEKAFDLFTQTAKEELEQEIAQGANPIIAPAFFDGLFETVNYKLDAWMQEKRDVLQDSEE